MGRPNTADEPRYRVLAIDAGAHQSYWPISSQIGRNRNAGAARLRMTLQDMEFERQNPRQVNFTNGAAGWPARAKRSGGP